MSSLRALLGPTNTGKTWRAVTRMLQQPSGMLGFPLRLLAREVYDRVATERGERQVALLTGEERRIGADARYFICTTEAMPDRAVAFLGVDEVQLAADPGRGHVFTDRLLHARGARETWFMGSDTIAPLLETLLPTIDIDRRPRFSKLRYAGVKGLGRLPPRSVVVAFSVDRVYELAEELRRLHGGTAVVLGALSPRTRNAQVAMYQAGEVPYMVATDAIGMGLNMDVDHVAFDSLRKFDGRGVRPLRPAEVAQIAGRAGRYQRDGTFGATSALPELRPELIDAIEQHRFDPVRHIFYRNRNLEFESPEALLDSLARRPPAACLHPSPLDEDERALRELLATPGLRSRISGAPGLRLMWELCRIPDFRKTLTGAHTELITELFQRLIEGPLPDDWIRSRVERLDRPDGDLDALATRLAWIRTWTYVSQRDWMADPEYWRARTRVIEDRLSDALHQRLTERFVDRRVLAVVNGVGDPEVQTDGLLKVGGVLAGRLHGLTFRAEEQSSDRRVLRAVREAVERAVRARAEALIEAPAKDLHLSGGQIHWGGGAVARLVAGPSLVEPGLKVLRPPGLGEGQILLLQRRLLSWIRSTVEEQLRGLDPGLEPSPRVRGILYQLRVNLGSTPVAPLRGALAELSPNERKSLVRRDIRFGTNWLYVGSRLAQAAVRERASLWPLADDNDAPPPVPEGPYVWKPSSNHAFYAAVGYAPGSVAIRVDVYEALTARLRSLSRGGMFAAENLEPGLTSEERERLLRALGAVPAGKVWALAARHPPRSSR